MLLHSQKPAYPSRLLQKDKRMKSSGAKSAHNVRQRSQMESKVKSYTHRRQISLQLDWDRHHRINSRNSILWRLSTGKCKTNTLAISKPSSLSWRLSQREARKSKWSRLQSQQPSAKTFKCLDAESKTMKVILRSWRCLSTEKTQII